MALAAALRTAITGSDNAAVRPSHVAEGVPSTVDDALAAAEAGTLDAAGLADALSAISLHPEPEIDQRWSLKPLVAFGAVAVVALILSVIGFAIDVDPNSPFLYPAAPSEQDNATPQEPVVDPDTPADATIPAVAHVYDPLGDGLENDETVAAVVDGDRASVWKTEPYPDPLSQIKDGVGVVLEASNPIGVIEITGTPETRFTLAWNSTLADVPDAWERMGAGQLLTGTTRLDVATREAGFWLVWITSVPQRSDQSYGASIAEIRLFP
jgi:hypothetical protein